MAVADVLRPLDGAEAQFTCGGRWLLSTALRESGRDQAAAPRRRTGGQRRSHPPAASWRAPTIHLSRCSHTIHHRVTAARQDESQPCAEAVTVNEPVLCSMDEPPAARGPQSKIWTKNHPHRDHGTPKGTPVVELVFFLPPHQRQSNGDQQPVRDLRHRQVEPKDGSG